MSTRARTSSTDVELQPETGASTHSTEPYTTLCYVPKAALLGFLQAQPAFCHIPMCNFI